MKWLALYSILLLAACQEDAENEFPDAPTLSERYVSVDESFSDIPIETPFANLDDTMPEELANTCREWGDCQWKDDSGTRHAIWGKDEDSLRVVVKIVSADEFPGKPIPALGIGTTRQKDDVIERVEDFLGGSELRCVSGDTIESCSTEVLPGWVTVDFDMEGNLLKVRFDGYHFT